MKFELVLSTFGPSRSLGRPCAVLELWWPCEALGEADGVLKRMEALEGKRAYVHTACWTALNQSNSTDFEAPDAPKI